MLFRFQLPKKNHIWRSPGLKDATNYTIYLVFKNNMEIIMHQVTSLGPLLSRKCLLLHHLIAEAYQLRSTVHVGWRKKSVIVQYCVRYHTLYLSLRQYMPLSNCHHYPGLVKVRPFSCVEVNSLKASPLTPLRQAQHSRPHILHMSFQLVLGLLFPFYCQKVKIPKPHSLLTHWRQFCTYDVMHDSKTLNNIILVPTGIFMVQCALVLVNKFYFD